VGGKLKITAISDSHGRHNKLVLPEGDVLVHAGDSTGRGQSGEILPFLDWVEKQDFAHKVIIPGNHDWGFANEPGRYLMECQSRSIHLLMESGVELDGVKLWGSAATPWFYSWAFNYRRTLEEASRYGDQWIKNIWDQIPSDTDVLITHGPPMGILDEVVNVMGESYDPPRLAGCEELLLAIKRIKPQVHIFGHIHCGYGEKHVDGTSFYNVAVCDEMYCATQAPRSIEII
jgi:Icc-related predicted phosphoesterase